MEQRPTYDHLIAGKLEQLPIPDMADAIWDRIERQLDIDLPTDDGGAGPAPAAPSGPGLVGWGLSVVIVAFITAWLFYKNKPEPNIPFNQPASTKQVPQPPAQKATGPPAATPTVVQKENTRQQVTPKQRLQTIPDSIAQLPVVAAPHPAPDSSNTKTAAPLVIAPPVKDSVQTGKKKRGVTGIKDEDYRIVPTKKDSS